MFCIKIHNTPGQRILAVCDQEVLGQTFRGNGAKITVSEEFYNGDIIEEQYFKEYAEAAEIINMVGNRIVDLALSLGMVSSDAVMIIGDVKHAQMVVME